MSNSEKISAYLENELNSEEMASFEKELAHNSELKNEFDFQKSIVEGIKNARKQELKAMLDNVPVGGAGVAGTITFGKVASVIAVLGLISYGVYHFTTPEEQLMPTKTYNEEIALKPSEELNDNEGSEVDLQASQEPKEETTKEEVNTTEIPEVNTSNDPIEETKDEIPEINRPSAAPMFETSEADSLEAPTDNIVNGINGRSSTVDVEIDNSKRKFSFHYQFINQKLHLYGNFNKDLYELLEFKTRSKKTLFLYYKDEFYPLDKTQYKITKLERVKEGSLIEKLEKLVDNK